MKRSAASAAQISDRYDCGSYPDACPQQLTYVVLPSSLDIRNPSDPLNFSAPPSVAILILFPILVALFSAS